MILTLAKEHTALRKSGANYVGKCPVCGGSDDTTRFVVNVADDFCHCYSCGFNADPVRFLRQIEGKTCPEAHRELGLICERAECPVWDKCSRGRGERPERPEPDRPITRPSGPTIHQAETPAELWQQKAAALVEHAHQKLLDNPDQLAYLAGRGLPREAVEKYRLGCLPEELYRDRAAWGLPEEISEKTGKPKKHWIPQGIVIPWADPAGSGSIHRIRIRKQALRSEKDPRYHWLPGSGNDIICLNPSARAHVIVESDLDGLLIDWLAGDLVATVPLGSCSTRPKATAFESLQKSRRILVALDFDKPQWNEQKQRMVAPGAEACGWWLKNFPDTWKRWPVPNGKDPGEAFQAGVDIRQWILDGLPPAMRVEVKAPVVTTQAETVTKTAEPTIGNDHSAALCSASAQEGVAGPRPVLIKARWESGHEFYVTDSPDEYRRLQAEGATVFSPKEIEAIKQAQQLGATEHDLQVLFESKRVLGGFFTETKELRG
jgi:hypothetical protein